MSKDKKKKSQQKKSQSRSKPKVYPMPKDFFGGSDTAWVGRRIDKRGGVNGKKLG